MGYCSCGFDIGDPRVPRHLKTCAALRIEELESARKDWGHQKWLLEMELEGYKELCKAQEFIISNLKVAQ